MWEEKPSICIREKWIAWRFSYYHRLVAMAIRQQLQPAAPLAPGRRRGTGSSAGCSCGSLARRGGFFGWPRLASALRRLKRARSLRIQQLWRLWFFNGWLPADSERNGKPFHAMMTVMLGEYSFLISWLPVTVSYISCERRPRLSGDERGCYGEKAREAWRLKRPLPREASLLCYRNVYVFL